jgi:hypothetical protein
MAGAQLGSFTYDMVLNYAKFEDAFTKAQRIADQHANQIKRSIQSAVDGVGDGLKDIAGKVAAAFAVEKLIEFGKQAIETADQMGKAAEKVGASVEAMSALSVQAQLSNVGVDQLQVGMEKLAKNAAAAASGNKQAAAGFAAIGVSLRGSNGEIKSTDVLLEDVAKKFAAYEKGVNKTALAQELFGKAGADLIPVLNELGEKGLAGITKQAEQFGAVISGDAAKAANEFNDNITMLEIEAKGFANSVTQKLLPSLNQLSGQMVESGKTTDAYAQSSDTVATAIKGVIAAALGIKEVIYGATTVIVGLYDAAKLTFSSIGDVMDIFADGAKKSLKAAFTFDQAGFYQADADTKARLAALGDNFVKESEKIKSAMGGGMKEAAANVRANFDALFNSLGNVGKGADETSDHLKKLNAPLVANTAAWDAAKAADERLQQMFYKDAEIIEKLSGKFGPLQKMYAEYKDTIIAANAAYQSEIVEAGKSTDQAHALAAAKAILTAKTQAAFQALQQETLQFVKANDAVQKYFDKVSDERALIGLTDRQKEISQAIQEQVRWWENLTDAQRQDYDRLGILNPTLKATQDRIAGVTGALYDQKKAAELNTQAAHEWQSIWSSAGNSLADTFAKVLVEGGSLFDGLKNLAKQTVEQIIAYFARLAVINPILNSIFGSGTGMGAGFSLLPTLANTAFGGGGGGAAINAAVGGGGAQNVLADGGASASGGFSFFSPTTWITAGKNLFNGFTGAGNAFAGAQAGAYTSTGGGTGAFLGANAGGSTSTAGAGFFTPGGGSFGGYTSGFGQALGVAGGLYAGVNEFKAAGGGFAGLAGGAAYGVGTYFAGAAVSTALAGGLSAGLAAIPVVGWIAIAAMLIDKFSGGKLFGTAWSTKASTTSLAIGPDGGSASAFLSQTKQGALFSGTKYRNKTVDAGKDAQDAAQSLFDSVEKIMIQAAHQIQIDVPPVIKAALDVVNTYDKKGKVTSTKYVVDILGKKYEEASQELAATRISAEAIVATVAASEAGKAASSIAEQWRSSADTLMDGAQFLVAATADLTRGINLLGDGGTLTQIADVVVSLQQGGEKLADTYARLGLETKIVQQAFELAHVTIGKTGEELVRFADAAATAAGGADQLTQLIQQFNQAYFSAAEIAQLGIDQLKKASDSALAAIGEDPAESMAKFKQDFLAALPNLSPEDLVKWYTAGVTLANYTSAVTDSANQLLNAKEQYAQFEAQLYGDQFISSFSSVIAAEQNQIDTANALAKAAGLAGASQEDLARITAQGTAAVRKAIADLTVGIQNDIIALNGGALMFGADATNPFGPQQQQAQKAQNDQANAAKVANAYDLIQKLGDYAFASGKSIDDVLKMFPGLNLDQIGGAAGISVEDTRKQIQAAEDNAAALTKMLAQGDEQTGLLSNILATLQGKPLPYDVSHLGAPPAVNLTSTTPLSKGGNQYGSPNSSKDLKAAVQDGGKPAVDEQKRTNDLLEKLVFVLTGQRVNSNRNTAGRASNFLPA